MTYIRNGTEYLDPQERQVWLAVKRLSEQGRSANSSQVAARTPWSRTTVTGICHHLKARGFLEDVSKSAAYHWRPGPEEPRYEET